MNIAIRSFKGIAPKIEPRYLPDGAAQVAINVVAEGQSVRPMRGSAALNPAAANTLATGVNTIYRGWIDYTGDDKYWLSNAAVVDVCRSQIAGDACEWTFMAEPNSPLQATNSILAIYDAGSTTPSTGVLPRRTLRLGIPAPTEPLTGWVNYVTPTTTAAELTIDSAALAQFITYDYYRDVAGFYISIDKGVNWFYPTTLAIENAPGEKASVVLTAADLAKLVVADGMIVSVNGGATRPWYQLSGNTQAAVIASLNVNGPQGKPTVTATAEGTGVKVTSRVAGGPATLYLGWNTTDGQALTREQKGTALTPAAVMNALSGTVAHAGNPAHTSTGSYYFTGTLLTSGGVATGFKLTSKDFCQVVGGADPSITTEAACNTAGGLWFSGEKSALSVKWGGGYAESKTATGTTENKGSYESRVYVYTWTYDASADHGGSCGWVWESAPSPPSDVANVFADSTVVAQRRLPGSCSNPAITERNACVANGGTWTYGAVVQPPTGYKVNGIRLYRSVAGQYLFVTEGKVDPTGSTHIDNVNDVDYLDSKLAAQLGEPCPSITWSPPPERMVPHPTTGVERLQYLNGIINLPNGMVAGFLGRDVYFAEPYRPFAWPENYIQTIDDPIVGLGRMDTTLAVLTTGNPYFIQGSEPSNMNVVKGDLEQSCVSKRSIVSMGRQVFYASPDGLVLLIPGSSSVVTEALFDRTYWQRLQPENIHAYGHDNKYVAFFGQDTLDLTGPNGTVYQVGGFVLDTASKQFYLHGFTARAGYHDLRNDTLYLATTTTPSTIVKWGQGAPVASGQAVWRSKMFGLPQGTGFSCGQVEAGPLTVARDGAARSAYPGTGLKVRVYADGTLFHTQTITNQEHYDLATKLLLSRRAPFRLPPLSKPYCTLPAVTDEAQCVAAGGAWVTSGFIGRDWEIELDVDSEIFNVALAQSMSEIASV